VEKFVLSPIFFFPINNVHGGFSSSISMYWSCWDELIHL